MRNHGWELPYHPLQVVAMTVFTELAFIFYVIFLPFVGGKTPQYVAVGIYTPLVTSVAVLYMWCVGTNPVCKSKNHAKLDAPVFRPEDQHSEENMSEVGISFCNLCEAEVLKNSKHCRECDKCVDGFDHHCKWLNNCIGKRNYKGFFTLLLSVVVLFVVQCLSGILVIILCIVKQGEFSRQIESELGCSFLTAAFLIVVVLCTILATIAAKALAQLLWFHILLIKEGISTDDYIRAMREQEEVSSSVTGISAASSFSPVHRGTWLTPPRLFLDDQFDVIPPEIGTSQNPGGKKMKSKIIIPIVGRYPLAPLQLEASSAFQPSTAASSSRIAASSPGSDGYEAGGEDSDC